MPPASAFLADGSPVTVRRGVRLDLAARAAGPPAARAAKEERCARNERNPQRNSATIDEYIAGFPPAVQAILERIREIVRARRRPSAQEAMSYQIPTFKLNGNLVHFAAFQHHIGSLSSGERRRRAGRRRWRRTPARRAISASRSTARSPTSSSRGS
jgi:hypothetical protein